MRKRGQYFRMFLTASSFSLPKRVRSLPKMRYLPIAVLLFSSNAYALNCTPKKTSVCENGSCKEIISTTKSWIQVDSNSLKRCDYKGCDSYAVAPVRSGTFHVYSIPSAGYFLKIALDNSFVEVASIGLAVFYKSGICEPSR